MILHNFRQFFENWIFEGISTGADLTKMVKNWIILNCAKKIFFGKIICSTHQQEMFLHNFRQFLENWIFSKTLQKWWKSTGAFPYKNGENLYIDISICAKKIFFGKIICSTHQRKCFSTILGNFWKIEFLKEYRQARTLTKMVKIWTILNCAKKIFFGKIICSTHHRKCFSTILGNFWKIEFLTKYRQARTLQKWWKFVFSQFVLRKYFLAKLFVPHIKGSVSHNFRQFLELNFWRNLTGADLTKMVKIWILNWLRK